MTEQVYLNELGIINAMGAGKETVRRHLLDGNSPGMGFIELPRTGKTFYTGAVKDALPDIPEALSAYNCRNNRLTLAAVKQFEGAVKAAIKSYSAERIGVVMGTSTSGVDETEAAMAEFHETGSMPDNFDYIRQEIGASAEFLALYYDLKGPAFAISTACSSSGKVFASARGLIHSGLCDAVLVGGSDTLCELTLNGFASLEAISETRCNPFSGNRNGINVGEAAAVFLMSKESRGPCLAGVGESADSYHISAPDPSGAGAKAAMLAALQEAGLKANEIGYINLHGTATKLNDVMESHAVYSVFGDAVPCSSTKPLTGHTLGAAGATEAGLCWLLLDSSDSYSIAPHLNDGESDSALSPIKLCFENSTKDSISYAISNSFAFGGNNVSIILGRNQSG